MIQAFLAAFKQLSDPRTRHVLKLGLLGALACYVILVGSVWFTLTQVELFSAYWADLGSTIVIGLAVLVLPILFFPALTTVLMGPWLDQVADAVEDQDYPHLPKARSVPWGEVIISTLGFLGLTIAINLLAMPIYLILLFTGFTIVLAYVVNGYLLGREYLELVAIRHVNRAEVKALHRAKLGYFWVAGALIYLLFTIPILNLAAPVIATAFMTRLYQPLRLPNVA